MIKSIRLTFTFLIVLGSFFVLNAGIAKAASATDNFDRANGGLGSSWTTVPTTQPPQISGNHLTVPTDNSLSSAYWSADVFSSNQYVQAKFTNTPSSNGGPGIGVRFTSAGTGYFLWVGGFLNTPGIAEIYRQDPGVSLTQLVEVTGLTIQNTDTWRLEVVGSNLFGYQNGNLVMTATDSTYPTGGSPGIWQNYSVNQLDDWEGGDASFSAHYVSTDGNGVKSYTMTSAFNGYGIHTLRILEPSNPAPGVAHNFLYVLPVMDEGDNLFGDGLDTLRGLAAQNQYNVTIIAPSFAAHPWYADHPTDPNYKYESFMVSELQPWVKANLATSGTEQHWLLGFSKSGFGPMHLILKHPDLFTLGSFWDFPADMSAFDEYDSATNYGTEDNFQNNYRMTPAFVAAQAAPFTLNKRLWISDSPPGAGAVFQTDVSDLDALFTSNGILHTYTFTAVPRAHNWDSGWVPEALAALYQNSLVLLTPPTLSTLSPLDDAGNVVINSNLVLTFSKNIAKGAGNILIKKTSDDSTVQTINVSNSAVTVSNTTVTIDLPSDLSYNTGYYVTMASGVLTDTSIPTPNAYAGISLKTAWNFTTALPDTIPPSVPTNLVVQAVPDFPNTGTVAANPNYSIIVGVILAGCLAAFIFYFVSKKGTKKHHKKR